MDEGKFAAYAASEGRRYSRLSDGILGFQTKKNRMHPFGRDWSAVGFGGASRTTGWFQKKNRCIRLLGLLVCAVGGWLSHLAGGRDYLWGRSRRVRFMGRRHADPVGVDRVLAAMFSVSGTGSRWRRIIWKHRSSHWRASTEPWKPGENQRLSGEHRQTELKGEIERQRQAVAILRDSEYRFRNLSQATAGRRFLVDVEAAASTSTNAGAR